ncbi:MAG: hypothetical protein EOO75_20790, partial [Myxococcales bacterium]
MTRAGCTGRPISRAGSGPASCELTGGGRRGAGAKAGRSGAEAGAGAKAEAGAAAAAGAGETGGAVLACGSCERGRRRRW